MHYWKWGYSLDYILNGKKQRTKHLDFVISIISLLLPFFFEENVVLFFHWIKSKDPEHVALDLKVVNYILYGNGKPIRGIYGKFISGFQPSIFNRWLVRSWMFFENVIRGWWLSCSGSISDLVALVAVFDAGGPAWLPFLVFQFQLKIIHLKKNFPFAARSPFI